jgi:hypothetical protein
MQELNANMDQINKNGEQIDKLSQAWMTFYNSLQPPPPLEQQQQQEFMLHQLTIQQQPSETEEQ